MAEPSVVDRYPSDTPVWPRDMLRIRKSYPLRVVSILVQGSEILQDSLSVGHSGGRFDWKRMLVIFLPIDSCRGRLCDLNVNRVTEQGLTVQIFHGTLCLFVCAEVGEARLAF